MSKLARLKCLLGFHDWEFEQDPRHVYWGFTAWTCRRCAHSDYRFYP